MMVPNLGRVESGQSIDDRDRRLHTLYLILRVVSECRNQTTILTWSCLGLKNTLICYPLWSNRRDLKNKCRDTRSRLCIPVGQLREQSLSNWPILEPVQRWTRNPPTSKSTTTTSTTALSHNLHHENKRFEYRPIGKASFSELSR
ncbi:unnamed protein product [Arabidopsis halleri]